MMQLSLSFENSLDELPARSSLIGPFEFSEAHLRDRVALIASSELRVNQKAREVDFIFNTVREAVADDDLIAMLVDNISERVRQHIDLAIDICAAGHEPRYRNNPLQRTARRPLARRAEKTLSLQLG